jgi:hypothetical protein
MRLTLGLSLLIFGTTAAVAVPPDECEQQRAQYPKNWTDVSNEQTLFDCSSHYAGGIRVKAGASDSAGRTLFSLVPLTQSSTGSTEDTTKAPIDRTWTICMKNMMKVRELGQILHHKSCAKNLNKNGINLACHQAGWG